MKSIGDTMIFIQRTNKLYENCLEEVRQRYHLSRIELQIMCFLHNNPTQNTIIQISSMRMLSKGNVSRGVELLIQRDYLERCVDENDRRVVHLILKESANDLIKEIDQAMHSFFSILFEQFTQEEYEVFRLLHQKMSENVLKELHKEEDKDGK